jgi:hypothetical protein
VGIVAFVILTLAAMMFYGSGDETSAVAVLGATLGTIDSTVGALVGVAMGTDSGASAGDAKTQLAKAATKRAKTVLTAVRDAQAPIKGAAAE